MQRICVQEGKIRIIFFIRSLDKGGAERQLVALASGLKKSGHDVAVFVMYPNGSFEDDLIAAGVKIVSLEKKGRWDVIGFFSRMVRKTREAKPEIFHSYLTTQNILSVMLKPFCGKMKIVWGIRSSVVDLGEYDLLTRITFWLERQMSLMADFIITNSRVGRSLMVSKGFPPDKMIVIPNGVDTSKFSPSRETGLQLRKEWGARPEEKIIGIVGRIDPMKDHTTFLKAASILCKNGEKLRFICVGSGLGPYVERMRSLADELGLQGRVIWTGNMDDMTSVYNAFDIVVCSSYGEGFPNSIGEAMACGLPCVVTNVGDLAWIVGETGIVVAPKDPQKLAGGVSEMLGRIQSSYSENKSATRERIVSMFGVEKLIKNTSQALLRLI